VKNVRKAGYKIHDVYTPFPVHGLDHAMGLRETSLHTAGFIYAITGTTTALTFMSWVFTKDWPMDIGGKPHFALPAWIPITFELNCIIFCRRYGTYILLSVPVSPVCKKTSFSSHVLPMIYL
jgi:hypothetical protein